MRSFPTRAGLALAGVAVLSSSLLGCSSSSSTSTSAPTDASLSDATSETGEGGNTCTAAGFLCVVITPTTACALAGPEYFCGLGAGACCSTVVQVDSGFCVGGGQTAPAGSCAGQACAAGCQCGLLQPGGMATSPPSGNPTCTCPTYDDAGLACFQSFDCGSIECTLGCTCSDAGASACTCPVDAGGGPGAARDGSSDAAGDGSVDAGQE